LPRSRTGCWVCGLLKVDSVLTTWALVFFKMNLQAEQSFARFTSFAESRCNSAPAEYEREAPACWPRDSVLPAYDYAVRRSHTFNADAGAISVTSAPRTSAAYNPRAQDRTRVHRQREQLGAAAARATDEKAPARAAEKEAVVSDFVQGDRRQNVPASYLPRRSSNCARTRPRCRRAAVSLTTTSTPPAPRQQARSCTDSRTRRKRRNCHGPPAARLTEDGRARRRRRVRALAAAEVAAFGASSTKAIPGVANGSRARSADVRPRVAALIGALKFPRP
jgi:hypothetical protein